MKERYFLNRFSFLFVVFVVFCFAFGLEATAFDKAKIDSSKVLKDNKSSFMALDIEKTYNLKVAEQFSFDNKGNIVYKDGTKMYKDFTETSSNKDEDFPGQKIPQLYFTKSDLKTQVDLLKKRFNIDASHLPTSLSIDESITGLTGECKVKVYGNKDGCIFASDKLEKNTIVTIGDKGNDSYGRGWHGIQTSNNMVVNANIITAIGGIEDSSRFGISNRGTGVVNANTITAIGGNKDASYGINNDSTAKITARDIVAIGGIGSLNGAFGIFNSGTIDANVIVGIAGQNTQARGIFNLGKINADIIVGISSGKGFYQNGIYNNSGGIIKSKLMISMPTTRMGSGGIFNEGGGKIETDTLVVATVGKKIIYGFFNGGRATVKAKNIYLQGHNAISNAKTATVTTNNLFIRDVTSIKGIIAFDSSATSSLVLDAKNSDWNGRESFFAVAASSANDVFTLNSNTKVSVKLSKEMIMKNNLAYGTSYSILGFIGDKKRGWNATLQDNRSDKKIYFEGLTHDPTVVVNQQGIAFSIQKGDSNIEPKTVVVDPPKVLPHPAPSTVQSGIDAEINSDTTLATDKKQKLIENIRNISSNAKNILDSIVEHNQKKSSEKFQQLTIGEAIKGNDIQTLQKLVNETDKTFSDATINMSSFSLQSVEYLNYRVLNRIASLSLSKNTINIDRNFKKWMQKYALASNDKKIYLPNLDTSNSAWVNFGGSYYETPSISNASFLISANATIGYDRKLVSSEKVNFILGGLFNYSIGNYAQSSQKTTFSTYSLGIYSTLNLSNNEFQGIASFNQLVSEKKVDNEIIAIENENYFNNNTAFNFTGFYKYNIKANSVHSIKPLVLVNYSFLYTPSSTSDLFVLKKALDHTLALGAGAEYEIQTESAGHILQAWGRYNFLNVEKSRSISFKGAQTFINYDLNPSKIWFRLGYNFKYQLNSNLFFDLSLAGDVSTNKDFLVMGNAGLHYVW